MAKASLRMSPNSASSGPGLLISSTITSSAIIQDIGRISETGTAHIVTCFSFDFKDTGKQDARAFLSSILIQLSKGHQETSWLLKALNEPLIAVLTGLNAA